jgi:FkbM family methyltransferase
VLTARSLLGKAIRLPLRLIPKSAELPILLGPTRGYKWVVGSSVHGCWLGIYEYRKRRLFERYVKPGMTVFDMGAHTGFYTLIASKLAGKAGQVFAFEPNPRNLGFLGRHLRINRVQNVTVMDVAASDRNGTASFDESAVSQTGRLAARGQLTVKTAAVDDLGLPNPDVIKMDIEGGEYAALRGMKRILSQRPILFLATHGDDIRAHCLQLLREFGYSINDLSHDEIVAS